jgi:hypothetical protein
MKRFLKLCSEEREALVLSLLAVVGGFWAYVFIYELDYLLRILK